LAIPRALPIGQSFDTMPPQHPKLNIDKKESSKMAGEELQKRNNPILCAAKVKELQDATEYYFIGAVDPDHFRDGPMRTALTHIMDDYLSFVISIDDLDPDKEHKLNLILGEFHLELEDAIMETILDLEHTKVASLNENMNEDEIEAIIELNANAIYEDFVDNIVIRFVDEYLARHEKRAKKLRL